MTSRARWPRKRIAFVTLTIAATLTALVTSAGAAAPTTPAEASPSPIVAPTTPALEAETMLVIGDSYSSYYGDRHSRFPGWWATLATDLGLEPQVDAVGGTGFLMRGGDCSRTRYRARMNTIRRADPSLLLVEGGRNDWRRCLDGRPVESTRTEIERATDAYFAALGQVWDELDRPRTEVYVLSPWGRSKARKGRVIRPIVRDAALRHGFSWVRTELLSLAHAPDGIHPNNQGSRFMSEQILQNSDLPSRFTRD